MALEAGISDEALRRRDVVRLSRDTYVPRATADDVRTRIEAVLLTSPDGAVVSQRTAAGIWRLDLPSVSDERVHVTVSTGSAVRGRADRAMHRRPLEPGEVTVIRGTPVTCLPRTWRDLAGVLSRPALLAVTDQVLAAGCSRRDLDRQLRLQPSGRGAARARDVLPIGDARSESVMESWTRWLIHEARLPMPDLQVDVRSDRGVFLGRGDFVWLDRKVLVEFDGDHHRERKTFVADLRRQNGLVAAGWTILRFTSADVLGRPEYVVATIRAALR
jgi:very-short-patch-repair endonuclease